LKSRENLDQLAQAVIANASASSRETERRGAKQSPADAIGSIQFVSPLRASQ
jgi:hypothetical protein